MSWQCFLIKQAPFQFRICTVKCRKFMKLSQIVPIGRPLFVKAGYNMGPQILMLAILFVKRPPFQSGFRIEN